MLDGSGRGLSGACTGSRRLLLLHMPAAIPEPKATALRAAGGGPDAAGVGSKGTVKLDARFDAGYFVSVRAAGQEFRGVLYYPPPAHVRPRRGRATSAQGDSECRYTVVVGMV